MADLGAADARIQLVDQDVLRIRSDIDDPIRSAEIRDTLSFRLGPIEAFEQVGPTWGADVTDKAVRALVVFFAVVALYLTIRLEWKMALGALVAVAHDIVVSVGFYSLFQLEITPATVIAFLTIMGYSLYDTIVVYDKVREVTGRLGASERYSYTELMNLALNRVTMRSINTSVSSALPVVSLLVVGWLIMGASALQEFGVALLVGIIIGSYSSLFLASAMVAALKEREPRWLEVTAKLDQRGVGDGPTRTVQRQEAAMGDARPTERVGGVRGPARRRPQVTAPTGGIPPRPRKKRR
jgi:preprotein translocase subunit SecF